MKRNVSSHELRGGGHAFISSSMYILPFDDLLRQRTPDERARRPTVSRAHGTRERAGRSDRATAVRRRLRRGEAGTLPATRA